LLADVPHSDVSHGHCEPSGPSFGRLKDKLRNAISAERASNIRADAVRALRILVVVMGIMLVGGFVALVLSIAYTVKYRQAAVPAAAVPAPYVAPAIELPSGTRIETMALGANRLVLSIITQDGNRELLMLDPASGRRLGTIPLRTAP
jgi:Family of unknown function (DUF6476)